MTNKEKAHNFAVSLNCEEMKMGELMALRQGAEIGYLNGLEEGKKEQFEIALSQIKNDREKVIEYNERLQKENESRKKYIEKLKKLIKNNTDFYGNDTELYQIWKGIKMEIG